MDPKDFSETHHEVCCSSEVLVQVQALVLALVLFQIQKVEVELAFAAAFQALAFFPAQPCEDGQATADLWQASCRP